MSTQPKTSNEIRREINVPATLHQPLKPTTYGTFQVSISTDIGGRKFQEDRFTLVPQLVANRNDSAFFGIFDGTVGDFASENVKDLVVPHLVSSPMWSNILEVLSNSGKSPSEAASREMLQSSITPLLAKSINYMYQSADSELISRCAEQGKDYASSTSVTVVLMAGLIGVGHLGDSRVALGSEKNGQLIANFLTQDHKPDHPTEKTRIMSSGGTVEYLHNHNNKPFIRGGDFTTRKQRGEQPMQLQYSRAFGGKDLKMFGLSNKPDVNIIHLEPHDRCLILASDGLWDVQPAQMAVRMAMQAKRDGKNPAEILVQATLAEQRQRSQSSDNITAMVVFFNE